MSAIRTFGTTMPRGITVPRGQGEVGQTSKLGAESAAPRVRAPTSKTIVFRDQTLADAASAGRMDRALGALLDGAQTRQSATRYSNTMFETHLAPTASERRETSD